jgi:hypothetical protein
VRTSLSLLWKFVEESEVNTVLSVSTFPTGSGPAELLNQTALLELLEFFRGRLDNSAAVVADSTFHIGSGITELWNRTDFLEGKVGFGSECTRVDFTFIFPFSL